MTNWLLILIFAILAITVITLAWLVLRGRKTSHTKNHKPGSPSPLDKASQNDVEHLFDNEFRQELRNHGRLYFEKIIQENAMFLQQDLRLTTSQLNGYMKDEITRKLQEEFAKYEQSVMDAKEMAIESLQKTNAAIDEQRQTLGKQVRDELLAEKTQLIKHFEANMGDIINHYLMAAIGDQIDLSDQLEYILNELEANKKAIIEDIQSGA